MLFTDLCRTSKLVIFLKDFVSKVLLKDRRALVYGILK